ncbi:MAG TPA: MASE1 domain-containing protein [Casimicrobiaceae bacterium]|nr:MASE1 domain-containing protein [Casimicrobiaceae bacterium]
MNNVAERTTLSRIWIPLGQMLLLAAVYFAAAKLSLLLAIPPGYATAVWPPSGIALAAMLLWGTRLWPGIWLGAALINFTIDGSPLLAALIATGNTLEAVVGTALIRHFTGTRGYFESGEDVVKFAALSALSATIAAAVGATSLSLFKALPWNDFIVNAWTWWQGDATAMMIVTPLIASWTVGAWPRWSLPKAIEAASLLTAVALVTLIIFGGLPGDAASLPLAFIALPFVIWAAIRFGQREVTTVTAIVCAIAVWYTIQGRGPFGLGSSNAALLFLVAYASTLVMTGLVLSAVIGERERAIAELRKSNELLEQRIEERTLELAVSNQTLRAELAEHGRQQEILRQSEERFRLLVDGVKDYAIFMLDSDGNVASWNTGAQTIYGYTLAEMTGTSFSRLYTPEDLARNWPEHELAVARAEGRFEDEGWRVRKDGSRFWANVIIAALYNGEHRVRGFAKVTRDLTVRRRIEALEESERQMNEFLAMLAHELRNPLASIVNALGLMRSKPGDDQGEFRAVLERQTTLLARIVDDLLDVSRITRGKISLKREILDMSRVVARTLASCRPLIDAHKHVVELQLADEELPVDADSTRLSQVVLNLISNAVKYTPEGGRITIAVSREDGVAVLRVHDTGIGIAPELLPKVFDLFVQGDRSLDRTEGGLGIGLTLVRRLVEMHGGSVFASSGGHGEGSEFVVRLPLALGRGVARGPAKEVLPPLPVTRRRLLVVDDNRDFADTLGALFETMGHDVRIAYNGTDAVSAAAEYRPDAVFLDIGLPGRNGYEVARMLRSSPELAGLTLVAFTGYGRTEDRRRVREAGFDYHLVKPAEAAELARIVDALPARAHAGNPSMQ